MISMGVTAVAREAGQVQGGLRPLNPGRDLGAIADLIAAAFAQEMDARSRRALQELRWMARLSPLVWWWASIDPSFRDSFNGFVWEEPSPRGRRRQVVGNVSLNQAPGNRRRWIVCNVVVRDDYRRRGIGRRLTEAAIAEAQALGAEGVLLQAYQDNLPALRLYTALGFQEAAGETEFWLEAVNPVAFLEAPGYQLRAWRPADGQAAYDLARLVIPTPLQWFRPLRAGEYRPGWWARLFEALADLMAGQRVYRLSVLKEDRLVAMMTLAVAFRQGEHQLALLVHPDHTGQVEAALVSRALHLLAALPPRPVRAVVDKEHTATIRVLREYGFREQRTLLTLRRDFTEQDSFSEPV